jgi:hypothetical protein
VSVLLKIYRPAMFSVRTLNNFAPPGPTHVNVYLFIRSVNQAGQEEPEGVRD